MALNIIELFGYDPSDQSRDAVESRSNRRCPFINSLCTKRFNDGNLSGVCTLKPVTSDPVVCCPNRIYAQDYSVLSEVAREAFGPGLPLISGREIGQGLISGRRVAVFGKRWGRELRLPTRAHRGAYFVDWILALITESGQLEEFVAVEVQSIDTTGNYRAEWKSLMSGSPYLRSSKAGFNWENVSKRILPQLIYKGHVLRREPLCRKGLFFICPTAVYHRIMERLGGQMLSYTPQPGSLTFRWHSLGPNVPSGSHRGLIFEGQFTATVDQIAVAFSSPRRSLPN